MTTAADYRIRFVGNIDGLTLAVMKGKEEFKGLAHAAVQSLSPITTPVRQIGYSLKALSDETGLTAIARHAGHATLAVGSLLTKTLQLAPALLGLGAGVGVFGVFSFAKDAAEMGAELYEGSIKTGIFVGRL